MCQSVSACRNSLCKYADDTYVIIPDNNEASRLTELDNVQTCTGDSRRAEQNNLKLNCSMSTEIIFRDNRRRHTTAEPVPLSGIARCSYMKMLGVTVGNDFSVSQHVQRLVTSSAQARGTRYVSCGPEDWTTPPCSTCSGLPSSPV